MRALIVFSVAPFLYLFLFNPNRPDKLLSAYFSIEFIVVLSIYLFLSYFFNKQFLNKTDFIPTYLIVNILLFPIFFLLAFFSFLFVFDYDNIAKFSILTSILAYNPIGIVYILLSRFITLKYLAFRDERKKGKAEKL